MTIIIMIILNFKNQILFEFDDWGSSEKLK